MMAIRTRSDNLPIGMLLAAVGGFLDAYTFVRYGVFANAQTGNVVLLAIDAGNGRWNHIAAHVPPVVAFVVGAVSAETLAGPGARRLLRRPTRVVLGGEIAVLLVVALLPTSTPAVVITMAVSFVTALQISTFKLLGDTAYNTTMVTGNLRTISAGLYQRVAGRDAAAGRRALALAGVVAGFIAGALVGTVLTRTTGKWAICLAAGMLAVVLITMVRETRALERVVPPAARAPAESAAIEPGVDR